MWMMPLHLHVNQKSDYDDDMLSIRAFGRREKDILPGNAPKLNCIEKLLRIQYWFEKLTKTPPRH